MTRLTHTMRLGLFVAILFGAMSQSGWSIVVGPLAGDSVETDLGYNATGTNYVLQMTEVAWAANGPYWLKNLRAGGEAGGPTRPTLNEGDTLTLVENIRVGGTVPWTDWHEVFTTDGISWTSATIYYAGTTTVIDGLTTVISNGGGDDIHMDNLDFFFNTLAIGTEITIVKTMQWQGLDTTIGSDQLGRDIITIREFPTVIPEPATLSLLAIGGGLFGLLRRRRSA